MTSRVNCGGSTGWTGARHREHVTVPGKPLRPRRDQVEYIVAIMEAEIERNRPILERPALAEFQQALEVYRDLLIKAR